MTKKPTTDPLKVSELTARISARMVMAPDDLLDAEITWALQEIAALSKVDRCGLLEIRASANCAVISHEWQLREVPHVPGGINLGILYPWSVNRLVMDREIVAIENIDDLPHAAALDQQSHRQRQTRSSLAIPVMLGDEVRYIFVLGAVKILRTWDGDFIRNMRLVGEIFVSALQRRKMDQELRQTKERLELAVDAAEAVFWQLDLDTGDLWASDKAFELFGFDLKTELTLARFLTKVHEEDHALIEAAVDRARRTGEELLVEYRSSGPDGGERWMLSRGRLGRSGQLAEKPMLKGLTMEITRQKSMEQELKRQLEENTRLRRQLEEENLYLRTEIDSRLGFNDLRGSHRMRAIGLQIEQVSGTDSTVLIQGETGSGKELIAEAIHRASKRRHKLLVKVNCAALPAALVESELFGREKGAFTGALSRQVGRFELADGATLFLDEIAEMPLEVQSKLLRVLQDGEFERLGSPRTIKVDVRIVAATNRDLAAEVEQGRFRRDLYFRLNVFPIRMPALRERTEDIPQLVWEFVNEFGEKMGKKISRIAQEDMRALTNYSWPGNVRELRNVIEHALIITKGDLLQLQKPELSAGAVDLGDTLEALERRHIQATLAATGGRIKGPGGAAQRLGVNPSTLYSRMHKLGIRPSSS
jgi:transcriptional regulator with GAF, ATPase, and Fis domain